MKLSWRSAAGVGAIILLVSLGARCAMADEDVSSPSDVLASSSALNRLAQVEAELAALKQAINTPSDPSSNVFPISVVSSSGVFAGAEATILAPQVGTLAATGSILGTGIGSVELTPRYNTFIGGRFWTGYRNADGLGGRVRFWDYDASATGTFVGIPLSTSFHALALDAEMTQLVQLGNIGLDFSTGIRWGEIGRSALLTSAQLGQNFSGFGPTAAFWARRPINNGNFAWVGGARTSFLFGNNNEQANVPGLVDATLTARNASVMVYEMQTGFEWSRYTQNGGRMYARILGESQVWQIPPVAFGLLAQTSGLVGGTFSVGYNW